MKDDKTKPTQTKRQPQIKHLTINPTNTKANNEKKNHNTTTTKERQETTKNNNDNATTQ